MNLQYLNQSKETPFEIIPPCKNEIMQKVQIYTTYIGTFLLGKKELCVHPASPPIPPPTIIVMC